MAELERYKKELAPYVGDTSSYLYETVVKGGKTALLEGQLGTMKDPDHGIYPMVTSSSTLAGYGAVGAGIPPYDINRVVVVSKAVDVVANACNEEIPQKLIKYLVGQYPFYKIIKDDSHNLVIVKAFNIEGELNKTVNKKKAQYKTPKINLPTRIVEFEMKSDSDNTLNMILDGGAS